MSLTLFERLQEDKTTQLTLSVIGLFTLLTLIIFILVNWTVFWSSSSENVTTALKWCSFIACLSALVVVVIDGLTVYLVLDGVDVTDGILISFALPFFAFVFKLFVYFIFVGQINALKYNDIVYRTSKPVRYFVGCLITISVLCVMAIMVIEPMLAMRVSYEDTVRKIYTYDLYVLNANELILSITVIVIVVKKLTIALRFENIENTFAANNTGVRFVDDGMSYKHVQGISGMDNEMKAKTAGLLFENGSKVKETNPVHIMTRLVVLCTFAIFWAELLFITLLIRRVLRFETDDDEFDVVRCVEAFCAAMSALCIYLHFASSFKVYNCLCKCCHNCCLCLCVSCVGNKQPTTSHAMEMDMELESNGSGAYFTRL